MTSGFLQGKRALITGIASDRSIASGIAEAMFAQGAELVLTYQNDKLKDRVAKVAQACGNAAIIPLDVADDAQIEAAVQATHEHWQAGFDIVVHAIAYAPREMLQGGFLENLNRAGFNLAHDISAYSFAALAKAAQPYLRPNASLLTLSYRGAVAVVPAYNVMGVAKAALEACTRYLAADMGAQGVRVNAISAGPIKTLAAAGIKGFRSMLNSAAQTAPLQRNVTIEEVGNVAAFLVSDLASAITGQVIYVDNGYSIMGMAHSE